MKTCVLCFSRRNAFEWTIRSRSRWNGVRSDESSSATARRAGYERAARGDSCVRSNASIRSWNERSVGVVWETVTWEFSQADRRRDPGSSVRVVPSLAALAAAVLDRRVGQPEAEADDGHEVHDRLEPVACVREGQGHAFAFERSHRASEVKPTITNSSQYCDRTASRASS